MTDFTPYFVDVSVPEAVVLDCSEPVSAHPNTCNVIWYRAISSAMRCDDNDAVQEWHPDAGVGAVATPAEPNANQSRCAEEGGLIFQAGINSGLIIEGALVEPSAFSCAVRYRSDDGDARSLITVNPNAQDTYLFLTEKGGQIYWEDQQGSVSLSRPAPQNGWVAVGYSHGKLSLSVAERAGGFGSVLRSIDLRTALAGSSDVFIGCRSHRKGILKTLGASTIHDILIWADRDINAGKRQDLEAVFHYCEQEVASDDI